MNNSCPGHPANVAYLEVDLPHTFPIRLRKFIPNIHFASAAEDGVREIRIVTLGKLIRKRMLIPTNSRQLQIFLVNGLKYQNNIITTRSLNKNQLWNDNLFMPAKSIGVTNYDRN